MVSVHFSTQLRSYTGGVARVEVDADSVRSLIDRLDEQFPGIAEPLTSGLAVAINGDIIPDAIYEPVPDGAEIHFMSPLSGG